MEKHGGHENNGQDGRVSSYCVADALFEGKLLFNFIDKFVALRISH